MGREKTGGTHTYTGPSICPGENGEVVVVVVGPTNHLRFKHLLCPPLLFPSLLFFPIRTYVYIYMYLCMYAHVRDVRSPLSFSFSLSISLYFCPFPPTPVSLPVLLFLCARGSMSVRRYLLRIGFSPSPSPFLYLALLYLEFHEKNIRTFVLLRVDIFMRQRIKTVTSSTLA